MDTGIVKMAKTEETLIAVEFDALTGESIERPFTKDEIADAKKRFADLAKQEKDLLDRAAARKSALAKLEALGLSAEEIAAL